MLNILQKFLQVTYISGFDTENHPNLTKVITGDHVKEFGRDGSEKSQMKLATTRLFRAPVTCNDDLNQKEVQEALQHKYDLIILSMHLTDCFLSVVHKQEVNQ